MFNQISLLKVVNSVVAVVLQS